MQNEGEPSVEEILESIKKVIARDNREAAQSERQRRRNAAAPETAALAAQDADADEIFDLTDAEEIADGEAAIDDGLTNRVAARAMRESLAALAMISEPGQPAQVVRSGETSLEGLVRDMLRPMLAKWLDDHLPEMVERLVKAEITRIAHKQR